MFDRFADDPYAQLADLFLSHDATIRGAVRREVIARQLDAHLPPPPVRVLDVGGGAGQATIPLARKGYEVTILDPSRKMLGRAQDALALEDERVRQRVRLVLGRGEDAALILRNELFDAALCHGVLGYVEDPGTVIHPLATLIRPGGLISIVAKNASALAMRPALEGRYQDALVAFTADRDTGGLGVPTRAHTVEGLSRVLQKAGVKVMDWYGVRIFTDHLGYRTPGPDLSDILDLEWEAGRRDPYRTVARLIHLLGRRTHDALHGSTETR